MQINELPKVIKAPPMKVFTPIFFRSMKYDAIVVMSNVKEFVKITETESELVLR